MQLTIIHVNQNVIRHNSKYHNALPVCRVEDASGVRYGREVVINGPSTLVYSPDRPRSCGAKVWIETHASVDVIDEVEYSVISESMAVLKKQRALAERI